MIIQKGLAMHCVAFVLTIGVLWATAIFATPTFPWWMFPAIIWSCLLTLHFVKVFVPSYWTHFHIHMIVYLFGGMMMTLIWSLVQKDFQKFFLNWSTLIVSCIMFAW